MSDQLSDMQSDESDDSDDSDDSDISDHIVRMRIRERIALCVKVS